jgi:hypothetical protein
VFFFTLAVFFTALAVFFAALAVFFTALAVFFAALAVFFTPLISALKHHRPRLWSRAISLRGDTTPAVGTYGRGPELTTASLIRR